MSTESGEGSSERGRGDSKLETTKVLNSLRPDRISGGPGKKGVKKGSNAYRAIDEGQSTEIFFKNHDQIERETATKTQVVEVGYINKMANKQQISPNLAEKMKMISESRFSNLMRSTSGADSEPTVTSGLALKKITLELRPTEDEETDRRAPRTTFDILGSQTQKSQRIPLIRDCCARLKAKRGEPYVPGQR
jgi:hypothetical protein